MASRYPPNFSFSETNLTRAITFGDYVNGLISGDLFEFVFKDEELRVCFKSIWQDLGLPSEYFIITEPEEVSTFRKLLLNGINRERKLDKNLIVDKEVLLKIMCRECYQTKGNEIMNTLSSLRERLLFGSKLVSGDRLKIDMYVSPLIMSDWIISQLIGKGMSAVDVVWQFALYDGTVKDHRLKMLGYLYEKFGLIDDVVLIIYYPSVNYTILPGGVVYNSNVIRFTDYEVRWYPQAVSLEDMIVYVNRQCLSYCHVFPHYGIYHVQCFRTEGDMVLYLLWTLWRSVTDILNYTKEVTLNDGFRVVRGGLISSEVGSYCQFINFLIFNCYGLNVDITSRKNLLFWSSYVEGLYKDLELTGSFSLNYRNGDAYGIPGVIYHQICDKMRDLRLSDRKDEIFDVLKSGMNCLFANSVDCSIEGGGRSQYSLKVGIPIAIGIPFFPYDRRVDESVVRFDKYGKCQRALRNFEVFESKSLSMVYCFRMVNDDVIDWESIINGVKYVISTSKLRAIMKEYFTPVLRQELMLRSFKNFKSFSLENALLLGSMFRERVAFESVGVTTLKFIIPTLILLQRSTNVINWSTLKLCNVIEDSIMMLRSLSSDGNEIRLDFNSLKDVFSKVLIIGTVGVSDPIRYGLHSLFGSNVSQIGIQALFPAKTALIENVSLNQSYSCVISDINAPESVEKGVIQNHINETFCRVLRIVEPRLMVWKVNYGVYQLVLRYLNSIDDHFRMRYCWVCVRSKYSKMCNCECYIVGLRMNEVLPLEKYFDFATVFPSGFNYQLDVGVKGSSVRYHRVCDFNELRSNEYNPYELRDFQIEVTLREGLITLGRCLASAEQVRIGSCGINRGISMQGVVCVERRSLTARSLNEYVPFDDDVFNLVLQGLGDSPVGGNLQLRLSSLGTFVRQVLRLVLRRLVLNLLSKTIDISKVLFVGVGDEQCRNVVSVPTSCDYVIIDPKADTKFEKYNVKSLLELFPFDDAIQRDALMSRIIIDYPHRKLMMFFTFMLFNGAVSSSSKVQLARLGVLCDLLNEVKFGVSRIFVNVYLCDGLEDLLRICPEGEVLNLYDDMYITKVREEGAERLYGTFSANYDPVGLLRFAEIKQVCEMKNVNVEVILPSVDEVIGASWHSNLTLNACAWGGLERGLMFCQLMMLSKLVYD